jgi:hypothetical protein
MMRVADAYALIAPLLPPPPSIAELAAHAEQLARELKIAWKVIDYRSFTAYPETRRIVAPAICTELDYAGVLHEIGHNESVDAERHGKSFTHDFLGLRSHCNTAGEAAAWTWARKHALVWTSAMEQEKLRCLATYKRYAAYGIADPIWKELNRVNGQLTIGHAFLQMQRREMANRSQLIERWTKEIDMYREDPDWEYADDRRRTLTADQRRKLVKAWKQAREAGKLRAPLNIATARLLLDSVTQQG